MYLSGKVGMGKPLKQAWIVDPAKIFSLYFLQSPGKVSQRSEGIRWKTRQNRRLPPLNVCLEPFGNSFMVGLKICDLCIKHVCRGTMRVSPSLLQKPFMELQAELAVQVLTYEAFVNHCSLVVSRAQNDSLDTTHHQWQHHWCIDDKHRTSPPCRWR